MRSPRSLRFVFALLAGTLTGVGVAAYVTSTLEADPSRIDGLLWPEPKELPQFALLDHRQARFDRARLEGRWSFLFFGYTHCPDVCPATLTMLGAVADRLATGSRAGDPGQAAAQFIFVTVDPARDTAQRLARYVPWFHPGFLGVTGDEAQIEVLTRTLGIFVEHDAPDAQGQYLVSHGSAVLLVDPLGRLVSVFQAPHDADAIGHRFERIRRFVEARAAARTAAQAAPA